MTVYETPVQYNINDQQQEQELSNIDYGENLGEHQTQNLISCRSQTYDFGNQYIYRTPNKSIVGGSGYPGQAPFPYRVYSPLVSYSISWKMSRTIFMM